MLSLRKNVTGVVKKVLSLTLSLVGSSQSAPPRRAR